MRKKKRGWRMPWRNIPPDFVQAMLQFGGFVLAGLTGSAARIAEQIHKGQRERVWSKELFTDATSFAVMLLVAIGVSEYFELGTAVTAAIAGVLCREGTPLLDNAIKVVLGWWKRRP